MENPATGTIHHLELWVPDLTRAVATWGWLLGELGYEPFRQWPEGQSWRSGATYIVIEQSPARTAFRHDRCRPGLNHLAFHVESTDRVDQLTAEAPRNGWRLMFADRHPNAGGDQHYAAYLENSDGFEVELVGPMPWTASPDIQDADPAESVWPVPPAAPQAQQAEPAGPAQAAALDQQASRVESSGSVWAAARAEPASPDEAAGPAAGPAV